MTGIPNSVRALVLERDQWCVFCGTPRNLHVHHRRIKGIGGSRGAHTDCPCNLVVLCSACHEDAHDDRLWAEDQGYVLSREVKLPGEHPIKRHGLVVTPDHPGGGVRSWPTCEGGWAA